MKINILKLIALFLIIQACNNEVTEESIKEGVNVNTVIFLAVLDNNGNDLLNPENENGLNTNLITIYNEENGVYVPYYQNHLDNPKGYIIYDTTDNPYSQDYYALGLYATHSYGLRVGEFNGYIQWSEDNIDTFKSKIINVGSVWELEKFWFNDSLIFELGSMPKDVFIINKSQF